MPTPDSDSAKNEALAEIKERIRAKVVGAKTEPKPAGEQTLELPDLNVLRHLSDEAKIMCAKIGSMPPQPPSLRGRIGASLVRLVQRALFWYTPQIRISIDGIVRLFHQYIDRLEEYIRLDRREKEISREQIADLSTKIAGVEARARAHQQALEDRIHALEAALRNYGDDFESKFRGLEASLSSSLEIQGRDFEVKFRQLEASLHSSSEAQGQNFEGTLRGLEEILSNQGRDFEDKFRQLEASLHSSSEAQGQDFESKLRQLEASLCSSAEAQGRDFEGKLRGLEATLSNQGQDFESKFRGLEASFESRHDSLQASLAADIRRTTFELQKILQHYFSHEAEKLQTGYEEKIGAEGIKLQQAFNERLRRELSEYERKLSAAITRLQQAFDEKLHREREILVSNMEFCKLKQDLAEQSRRISVLLEEARKAVTLTPDSRLLTSISDEFQHQLDSIYLSFEDIFRGNREDIKQRLRVYLPMVKEAGVGTFRMPILDVGCGRGEWLELLREENLKAGGMDINRSMLAECRNRGLDVTEGDVLAHLKALPDASLGAITGFHLVEHLPFEALIAFLDETLRVLKPGGIAVFETPNPENLLVLSRFFYLDPTHHNPIPSHTLKFLVEARGLCRVEVLQLNPFDESFLLRADGNNVETELATRFNSYFYGPQDYAVVGRKL